MEFYLLIMHGIILMHNAYTRFFLFFWDTLKNPFWGTMNQFNSIQFLPYPTNNRLSYPTGKKFWYVSYSIRITQCIISKYNYMIYAYSHAVGLSRPRRGRGTLSITGYGPWGGRTGLSTCSHCCGRL